MTQRSPLCFKRSRTRWTSSLSSCVGPTGACLRRRAVDAGRRSVAPARATAARLPRRAALLVLEDGVPPLVRVLVVARLEHRAVGIRRANLVLGRRHSYHTSFRASAGGFLGLGQGSPLRVSLFGSGLAPGGLVARRAGHASSGEAATRRVGLPEGVFPRLSGLLFALRLS